MAEYATIVVDHVKHAHSTVSERLSRYDPLLLVVAAVGGTVLYAKVVNVYRRSEEPIVKRLVGYAFSQFRRLPPVKAKIAKELETSKAGMIHSIHKDDTDKKFFESIPENGLSNEDVLKLAAIYEGYGKFKVNEGRVSGAVYTDRHESHIQLLSKIYERYAYSNPLHPDVFPGARKMEAEIIKMVLNLYHAPETGCGSVTTGGTESIIMACLAHRNRAHKRGISNPVIVASVTVHAAFDKAAQLCGMRLRHVKVDANNRVNLKAMEKAIDSDVCLLVGSAPNFPSGTIDPIPEIAALGQKYGIAVHVDACLGGFLIPFMEENGFDLPCFDFRNPGVMSITCDTHKYGCTPKGSSVVMYRTDEFLHNQYFCVPEWTGGIYATPTITGSRAGANAAVAWATLLSFGRKEYVRRCKEIVSHTRMLADRIKSIPHIRPYGTSDVSVVAFGGEGINIYAVSDRMNKLGWNLNTLQNPDAIHICLTINQASEAVVDAFVDDLTTVCAEIAASDDKGNKDSTAALYGMAAQIPDKSLVDEMICLYLDACYAKPPN